MKTRIDFIIPLLIAFAVGSLINWGGGKIIDAEEAKAQEDVYSDTLIGAAPTENVPVVSSIAEMMEEEYFTFHVDSHYNASVYHKGTIYDVYEMESGELVLVDEYFKHSYYESENSSFNDFYLVLPIGKVVHKPLSDELIEKVKEEGFSLSDTSFYVDMRGKFKEFSRDDMEQLVSNISLLVGFIVFFIIRYVLIASGIFPPLFPLRFLKSWKKFITYYGVLYYDENIEQILAYRKQEKYEEAASEFVKLTGTSLDEARAAMNIWENIYGEGILPFKEIKY